MQFSISKAFGAIRSLNTIILLLVALLALSIVSEYASFYKLENLHNEKEIATTVHNLSRDDLDLANIQYRGKNTLLRHESNSLFSFYEYDYINVYSKTGNYSGELYKLQAAIKAFDSAANQWFTQEETDEDELATRQQAFDLAYGDLISNINAIIENNALYEEKRFVIQLGLSSVILLLLLFSAFWTSSRFKIITKDLNSLSNPEGEEGSEFATLEAETISKYIGRAPKTVATKNPAYTDTETEISSYKGLMHEFNAKKSQTLGNYTALCVFSIDKLSEIEIQYPQELSSSLVKKVSFMLSLYRQRNDLIARIDHNQFAILLSRPDKTSAINDCELIRKSVEEATFKTADGQDLSITLSGGFVQKMSTQNLDEVITKANKVLSMSIQHGGNRIAQLRDKNTALK